MSNFLTVMLRDVYRNPIKSLWWRVFSKIINDFWPFTIFAKKLHHTTADMSEEYLQLS